MTLSVAVVAFMFIFCYLPQGTCACTPSQNQLTCAPAVSILFFVNGPLAAFTTILLTLSESSTIITILSKNFLIADALVDTFDGTLIARNETGVVAEGRQIKSGSDPINKVCAPRHGQYVIGTDTGQLGKLLKSPFEKYSPKALIRYVMYLPLNFIPVVGTIIFVFIQGEFTLTAADSFVFLI
jgi:hypothetical protein